MNKEELEFIQELKNDRSVYNYNIPDVGRVRLMIIYRGERLFFQLNDKALICLISAHEAKLSKKSLKKWDDGTLINVSEKEKICQLICQYYTLSYVDQLTLVE